MDTLLIVAPQGRDAEVIEKQLRAADIDSTPATPDELVAAIREGLLGVAIVTDDALDDHELRAADEALAQQPPWSDYPFILLTPRSAIMRGARAAAALGNITVLERPLHPTALVSAARAALRARARQRRAQDYLAAREKAEEQVRELAVTLEARVELRTSELTRAMADRATAQALLDESVTNYRYTIDLSTLIPWTASPDGQIISMGAPWFAMTNATEDETLNRGWLRSVHPEDVPLISAAWSEAIDRCVPIDHQFRIKSGDKFYRWIRWRAAPRTGPDGRVLRWYGTVEDIDHQRQAMAQLQQLQADLIHVSRLSAMGAMGTTLAHELNQPLTTITNYVRGCRRLAEAIDPHIRGSFVDALNAADRSAARAGEIVRRLREFVANGDVARRDEYLPTLIDDACSIAMVDATTRGLIWRKRFDDRASTAMIDRIQIQQVVINLLRNSVEALRGTPSGEVLIETSASGRRFCEIAIHDNGPGLDAERRDRLFTPFTTSKAGGMGIGLSISLTIVEAHGGRIWYEPRAEGGSVFRFTVPRS